MTEETTNTQETTEPPAVHPFDAIDPAEVKDLTKLGQYAQRNTRELAALSRSRTASIEAGGTGEEFDQQIRERQVRSGKMIRRRQTLQTQKLAERRAELEEALKPTTGRLNEQRIRVMELNEGLLTQIKEARQMANDEGQRRLAARLKAWEDTVGYALAAYERLSNLDSVDLDIEES
jgi:hypothetical protein